MQSIFFYPHRNIACRTTDCKMYLPEIFIGNCLFFAYHTAKLLQKSEMRKDIVIELSYKGFG